MNTNWITTRCGATFYHWGEKKHHWKTGINSLASGELRGDPPRNPALLKSELGFTHLRLEYIQTFPAPKGRGVLFWVAGVMKVKARWSGAGALTNMRECCQAPRPPGCSQNWVNMMLATDRVNSFPELYREATQFKHRRLPCSCLPEMRVCRCGSQQCVGWNGHVWFATGMMDGMLRPASRR